MKIKFKIEQIWLGFPLLLLISVALNVSILRNHERTLQEYELAEGVEQASEVGKKPESIMTQNEMAKAVALIRNPALRGEPKNDTDPPRKAGFTRVNIQPSIPGKMMAVEQNGRQDKKRKNRRRKNEKTDKSVQPRQLSLAKNATVSACLLIRDDNDILSEWIAYHYHVVGLRHLIIAADPLSQEWPSDIAMRWRLMTNLEVVEWTDQEFMPDEFLKTKRPPKRYMQKPEDFQKFVRNPSPEMFLEVSNHRYRQRVFLTKCMKRFRDDGRSWVLHTDTDEFIVPSKLLRQMKPKYVNLPSMEEPNSVLSLLQQTVEKTPKEVNYPCLSLLRVLFGAVESTEEERQREVPKPFRGLSFETLRWRYHALPHNMTINGNPKVLLDVASIPKWAFHDIVFSIHRPLRQYCHVNSDLSFRNFRRQPIGVNHYLGAWERYSGRNDTRRSRELYDAKASVRRGMDDGLRLWLKGFCQNVGVDVAVALLGESYIQQHA